MKKETKESTIIEEEKDSKETAIIEEEKIENENVIREMGKRMELKFGDKVALVGCSNPLPQTGRGQIEKLAEVLEQMGLIPVVSDCVYETEMKMKQSETVSGKSIGNVSEIICEQAVKRAECLMKFYRDEEIKVIFDISGGDMANEILPHLDFETISRSQKPFWGYSDLTTIINAVYAKTGQASVLYQVRNLVRDCAAIQQEDFFCSMREGTSQLFDFEYEFVQGSEVCGILLGGNIRCLLKLAGTPYWPDMEGKLLFLEARSGTVPQMITFLSQLSQMGVFEQIAGLVLGTFTQMEREQCEPDIVSLVKQYVNKDMPIIHTGQIGHGSDSKALVIGAMHCFRA